LNGIDQFLVYADVAGLLDENINIVKNNTEALLKANKEVEVNTEKTKYIFMSCYQTKRQNPNKYFENVAKFSCLGTMVTK
jgi:HSP20 family molecular chaperone IbpA